MTEQDNQIETIQLYKTGEVHSNGSDVYRKVGDKPNSNGKFGMLGGQYFTGDDTYMLVHAGQPYKDEYGVFDAEADYVFNQPFIIVTK
mgnify:FL=1